MRCDECIFWENIKPLHDSHEDEKVGKCRRYPPKLDLSEQEKWEKSEEGYSYLDYRYWNFPVVESGEWCGEFKPV